MGAEVGGDGPGGDIDVKKGRSNSRTYNIFYNTLELRETEMDLVGTSTSEVALIYIHIQYNDIEST